MGEFDIKKLLAQAQEVSPTGAQWFVEIQAPAEDPFKKQAWRGVALPDPSRVPPSAWLSGLYSDLNNRLAKGYELLDQPDLTPEAKAKYEARLDTLSWQIHLMQLVARELIPCPPQICANRVGGAPGWVHPDHRDQYLYQLKQAHQAGNVAITVKTPGGRQCRLVPWRSEPPVAGELDPLDMAAVARVAALAGIDELTALDRLEVKPLA
ncbi:MAG TPA: hypothetical protein VD973_09480 [Symbiobacteriaceae bacterium]|nr:hypothetical protein [Symbiobacteriaceae bacterium]